MTAVPAELHRGGVLRDAGVPEELHLATVVARGQDTSSRRPVDRVDIGTVRFGRPDSLDRPPERASEGVPVDVPQRAGGCDLASVPDVGEEKLVGTTVALQIPAVAAEVEMGDVAAVLVELRLALELLVHTVDVHGGVVAPDRQHLPIRRELDVRNPLARVARLSLGRFISVQAVNTKAAVDTRAAFRGAAAPESHGELRAVRREGARASGVLQRLHVLLAVLRGVPDAQGLVVAHGGVLGQGRVRGQAPGLVFAVALHDGPSVQQANLSRGTEDAKLVDVRSLSPDENLLATALCSVRVLDDQQIGTSYGWILPRRDGIRQAPVCIPRQHVNDEEPLERHVEHEHFIVLPTGEDPSVLDIAEGPDAVAGLLVRLVLSVERLPAELVDGSAHHAGHQLIGLQVVDAEDGRGVVLAFHKELDLLGRQAVLRHAPQVDMLHATGHESIRGERRHAETEDLLLVALGTEEQPPSAAALAGGSVADVVDGDAVRLVAPDTDEPQPVAAEGQRGHSLRVEPAQAEHRLHVGGVPHVDHGMRAQLAGCDELSRVSIGVRRARRRRHGDAQHVVAVLHEEALRFLVQLKVEADSERRGVVHDVGAADSLSSRQVAYVVPRRPRGVAVDPLEHELPIRRRLVQRALLCGRKDGAQPGLHREELVASPTGSGEGVCFVVDLDVLRHP
eukprot:scaffold576_cov260-Pinguiococcus_pyrenoidosus.AAC.42